MARMAASKIACHECDLLNRVPPLEPGQKAWCPRCGFLLAANRDRALDVILAFSVTALLFLLLASAFPFLEFSASGQERAVTLLQSVTILVTRDFPVLAFIVFLLIVAIPATVLLGIIYVLTAVALGRRLPYMRRILRWVLQLLPWSMADIFLIGILVSFVKIVSLADVALGLSFWSYVMFTVCVVVVSMYIDKRELWRSIGALHGVPANA